MWVLQMKSHFSGTPSMFMSAVYPGVVWKGPQTDICVLQLPHVLVRRLDGFNVNSFPSNVSSDRKFRPFDDAPLEDESLGRCVPVRSIPY